MATDYLIWNTAFEATPAGTDLGSTLDDRIQELKKQLRIRAAVGGHVMENITTVADDLDESDDGKHAVLAGGASTPGPDIYKSDQTTKLVEFADDSVDIKEELRTESTDKDYGKATGNSGGSLAEGTDYDLDVEGFVMSATPKPVLVSFMLNINPNAVDKIFDELILQVDRNDDGTYEEDLLDYGVTDFAGSNELAKLNVGVSNIISGTFIDTGATAASGGDIVRYRIHLGSQDQALGYSYFIVQSSLIIHELMTV